MKIKFYYIICLLFLLHNTNFADDFIINNKNINTNIQNNKINIIKKINFQMPFYIKFYAKNSILYTYKIKDQDKYIIASSLYLTPKKLNNNNNIIVFAHGTIGVNPQCSIESNLGLITQFFFIKAILKAGYKVIVPNYRGFGETNVEHIYLNAKESAEDVLNAIQAVAQDDNNVQNSKIILWGISQGGIATQRAAEMSSFYAPNLNIIGSVQNSPPFNIVIPYKEFKKEYINIFQYILLPYLVSAVVRSNNDISFNDYYKSSFIKENERGQSLRCINFFKNFLISNPFTLQPNQKAAIAMEEYLNQQKAPKYKTDIPLLLIRGKKDNISKISNKNIANSYLKLFCSKGFIIQEIIRNGGHFRLKDIKYSLLWIKDRFAGKTPKNSCNN